MTFSKEKLEDVFKLYMASIVFCNKYPEYKNVHGDIKYSCFIRTGYVTNATWGIYDEFEEYSIDSFGNVVKNLTKERKPFLKVERIDIPSINKSLILFSVNRMKNVRYYNTFEREEYYSDTWCVDDYYHLVDIGTSINRFSFR